MILKVKRKLGVIKNNYGGWSTNRKILVIESDDWGSIRIPSKFVYDKLQNNEIPVDKCPFLSFDHLEQKEDFTEMYSLMQDIQKNHNKSPIITANYIMANPDFQRIKDSDFKEYHYISFKDNLKREGRLVEYMQAIEDGKKENWFQPQLHGREHVNIGRWLHSLQTGSTETQFAFENEVYGISTTISKEKRRSYLPALDYENDDIFQQFVLPSLKEGQQLFKDFFGYYSKSFIAPNYTWDSKVEDELSKNKIEYIQSSRNQLVSIASQDKEGVLIKHKTGERNKNKQIYLVRNAIFEPSTVSDKKQHLKDCLSQINLALMFKKPAILSMHRLNFMGGLSPLNRAENLDLFKELIETLMLKYPDIEFMTSDQLGDLIKQTKDD